MAPDDPTPRITPARKPRSGATPRGARADLIEAVNLEELASRPSVSRLLRNDARVLEATVLQIAEAGWDGLSIKAVAQRAQLSEQAVKDRHGDRNGLVVAAWRRHVGPAMIGVLDSLCGAFVQDRRPVARAASAEPWRPLVVPDAPVRAGFELLVIAQFIPELLAAVDESVGAHARSLCGDAATTPTLTTHCAFLLMRALGLGLLSPILDLNDDDLRPADEDMVAVFQSNMAGDAIPELHLPPFLSEHFDDDPRIDALLRTTLDQIARNGFHDTSLTAITDAVGVPKAFALTRYRSKLGLLLEASRVQRGASLEANVALQRRLREHTDPVLVTAAFTRAALRPGLELPRALNLEQTRLATREPSLRASIQDRLERETLKLVAVGVPLRDARMSTLTSMTLAEGIPLLPTLLPDAWALPWDVAWRPLMTPHGAGA